MKGKPPNSHQLLKPKNDFVFKLLFGSQNKHSKTLLIHFLNDFLQVPEGQSHPNVHLLNPHINKQHLSDKASILDIRVQIPGGSIVNIEMQLNNQYNMDKRTLYYCGKLISNQLDEGENYRKLRKTTTINLLNFNYFSQANYHSIYHLTEKHTDTLYPDLLQLHFLEMKKCKTLLKAGKINPEDRVAKWIEFISNEDDDQWGNLASKHPIIKKAVEQLEIISQNPENRWDYEVRQKALKDITTMKEGAREEGRAEGREEGKAEGREEGKAEGRTEGRIEVAKKMLQEGIELDLIIKLTSFTRDKILELQKEMEQD